MSNKQTQDEEPEEPEAPAVGSKEAPHTKGKRMSFRGIRRELSDDELKSLGVQKMLLDELDRVDAELAEAKGFEDKFHGVDKKEAVLTEKFKTHTVVEVLSAATLATGAIIIGYVVGIWENQPTAGVFLVVGMLLLLAGLLAKAIKL